MTENITEYYELVNKSREHGQILSSLQPCPQADKSANKTVHLAHWAVNTVLFFVFCFLSTQRKAFCNTKLNKQFLGS